MTRRLASIGVILRKDVLTLWPLVAFAAAVPLLRAWWSAFAAVVPIFGALAPVAAALAGLLIFTVVQNDAPASARHDWLTRPIRRSDMVLAKLVFLLGAVGLPFLIGDMIHLAVAEHLPFGEVLLAAGGQVIWAAFLVPIVALASVTANKIEGIVAFVGTLGLVILTAALSGKLTGSAAIIGAGGDWARTWIQILVAAGACALVLWLQYRRRSTLAARLTIVGAVVALVALSYLPRIGATASAQTKAGPTIEITDATACLTDDPFETVGMPRGQLHWNEAERNAAGKEAKVVLVSGRIAGLPKDWTVAVDRLDTRYVGAGKTIVPRGGFILKGREGLTPFGPGTAFKPNLAPAVLQSDWLISKDEALVAARQDAVLHFDASLTLLKPARTYRFPADGQRHRLPGFGYCGVISREPGRGSLLDCRTVWPVPAQYIARSAREPATCMVACAGSTVYGPVWAQLPITRRYRPTIRNGAEADDVVLTTYEIAGRVRRDLTIPGPTAACPAPATAPTPALIP